MADTGKGNKDKNGYEDKNECKIMSDKKKKDEGIKKRAKHGEYNKGTQDKNGYEDKNECTSKSDKEINDAITNNDEVEGKNDNGN